MNRADAKLWLQKWRWYQRNALPWNRVRIHREFARRHAFAKWPVHGEVLEMFRDGRLDVGPHAHLEPGVWLTAMAPGRIRIGGGTFVNMGVQIAAVALVERPARLAPVAIVVALVAARMSTRFERLAFAAAVAGMVGWVLGMTFAVITDNPLI